MSLINRKIVNRIIFPQTRKEELARAKQTLSDPVKLSKQQLIEAWAVVGKCYMFDKGSQLSEEAYLNAIEVICALGDERLLGEGYEDVGDAMYFCGNYSRAITYYRQSFEIFGRLNETEQLITALSQMAYSYAEMGQREEERHCLNSAILQSTIDPVVKATFVERMALSLSASGEYEEAITAYEQALSMYESEGFRREWQKRLQSLSQLYSITGDEEGAKRTLARL
jgi:tetratricopeptide (TPR) repeat protein